MNQTKAERKDGIDTKRRLVDTAERLFAEKGVENVTLVDVSREAGQKNRNAAQYHFGDRIGLINAVMDKHSEQVAEKRLAMIEKLEAKSSPPSMQELVEASVLPIAEHVESHPNGLTYLMLNRQLISSGNHVALGLGRARSLPDVLQLQRMMAEKLPARTKAVHQAKMILVQCMLFNGLANFYDMNPEGDNGQFVKTLCSSIVAVLMNDTS